MGRIWRDRKLGRGQQKRLTTLRSLSRARRHAARYSRNRDGHEEAQRIAAGEADDVPIMQALMAVVTERDCAPANVPRAR